MDSDHAKYFGHMVLRLLEGERFCVEAAGIKAAHYMRSAFEIMHKSMCFSSRAICQCMLQY